MWHPFKKVNLEAIVAQDVEPAVGPETTDDAYKAEVEHMKLRSLLARTQITMIHEDLASRALCHMRGRRVCPE